MTGVESEETAVESVCSGMTYGVISWISRYLSRHLRRLSSVAQRSEHVRALGEVGVNVLPHTSQILSLKFLFMSWRCGVDVFRRTDVGRWPLRP